MKANLFCGFPMKSMMCVMCTMCRGMLKTEYGRRFLLP